MKLSNVISKYVDEVENQHVAGAVIARGVHFTQPMYSSTRRRMGRIFHFGWVTEDFPLTSQDIFKKNATEDVPKEPQKARYRSTTISKAKAKSITRRPMTDPTSAAAVPHSEGETMLTPRQGSQQRCC